MYQRHATEKRYDAAKRQPVFPKQFFRAYIPPADPEQYYDRREYRTPPAHEEGCFIGVEGSRWRGRGVEGHDRGLPRPSASAEGTSEELEKVANVLFF